MNGRQKKSGKPFATSSKPPPEDVTFFIDASLGGKILARALRSVGAKVEVHNDYFPQGTPDTDWLHDVGTRGWIVLTKDNRIRYHELERIALLNARVRSFVLTVKGLRGPEIAELFVKALPAMRSTLKKYSGPFIAKVTRSAKVKLIVPISKSKRR